MFPLKNLARKTLLYALFGDQYIAFANIVGKYMYT